MRFHALRALALLTLFVVTPVVADPVPRIDLDRHSLARSAEPSRIRWFVTDVQTDRAGLRDHALATDAELVGWLDRLDGRGILEADASRASEIESAWSDYAVLRRDVRGTPALATTTRLVGAGPSLWEDLELQGDPTATVAILDSGADTAHDDLGDRDRDDADQPPAAGDADDWFDVTGPMPTDLDLRVVGWHDVTDDLPAAVGPWDYHYHGTAMASAGFGSGRQEEAGRGVAPRGRVAVVKTWNFEQRWELWASDLLLGFEWVLANAERLRIRACVVGATWPEDLGFDPAVARLREVGILVVAPAGNDPSVPMGFPARTPGVFAVGATDRTGALASYSQSAPPGTSALDLVAPGGSLIDPAGRVRVADNEPQDAYAERAGTSIAAAHVAGAVSLVSEAAATVSRTWTRDEFQVAWLEDLFRVTAAPVTAYEDGRSIVTVPGGTSTEAGRGLLQVQAALGAVREVVWPGDRLRIGLGAPADGPAVWAARVPVAVRRGLALELELPPAADFDLEVYREESDGGIVEVASARTRALGGVESLTIGLPRPGAAIVVVKRIQGTGVADLALAGGDVADGSWPVRLSARQISSPTAFDLDGDGTTEVVAVNNLRAFPDGHAWFAVDPAGDDVGVYPEQYFTPGRAGELTIPAIARLGALDTIVSGSEFGQVIAVQADGDLRWIRTVAVGPTSSCIIADPGADGRVAVGTKDGLNVLDAEGDLSFRTLTPDPIERAPAAGDLDGDGRDEFVVVDTAGSVWAIDDDGAVVSGWPVALGGELGAPLLLGDGTGAGVVTVAVVQTDVQSRVVVHRLAPDGGSQGATLLDLDGRGGDATSPLVAAPLVPGSEPSLIVATLTGRGHGRASVVVHALDAGVATRRGEWVLDDVRFDAGAFEFYREGLGELRVAQLGGGSEREVIVPIDVGWAEFSEGREMRFGGSTGFLRVGDLEGDAFLPLAHERVRFDDLSALAPVLVQWDDDNRPEWVIVREAQLVRFGSDVVDAIDDTWADARGGPSRRACVDCEARVAVDAPSAVRTELSLLAAPNPFNPRTLLRGRVPGPGRIEWTVYDSRGRRVRAIADRARSSGPVQVVFDGTDGWGRALASGVYHARLRWKDREVETRLVLVR